MRVLVLAIIATVFGAAAQETDALPELAAKLKVPHVRVPKLSAEPNLEGAPDLKGWAGPLALGILSGAAAEKPSGTQAWLATTATHLLAVVRAGNAAAASTAAVPLDGDVWAGDNIELMLLPGIDPAGAYFQLAANSAGSLFDARINDKSWNSGATVKVYRDGDTRTTLLSLPFSALCGDGKVPALWRINIHDCRDGGKRDLAWSPTLSKSNHVPTRFGLALLEGHGEFNAQAALDWTQASEKLQILFQQDFSKDTEGFSAGERISADGETFLRATGQRTVTLERNFGPIQGLRMAFAYRTSPGVHGMVVRGSGTVVRVCCAGLIEVVGRGLKAAETTCHDADRQSRAFDLGRDAFLFKRPYGH